MQAPPGKEPWQWLALMSSHKGLLPASAPLKSLSLAAPPGTEGLFLHTEATHAPLSLA